MLIAACLIFFGFRIHVAIRKASTVAAGTIVILIIAQAVVNGGRPPLSLEAITNGVSERPPGNFEALGLVSANQKTVSSYKMAVVYRKDSYRLK